MKGRVEGVDRLRITARIIRTRALLNRRRVSIQNWRSDQDLDVISEELNDAVDQLTELAEIIRQVHNEVNGV